MFRKLLKIISPVLLIAMFLFAQNAFAQVSNYGFASTAGTYTEITGGTVQGTIGNDDENFNAIDLGFTFTFNGVAYTQVSVNTNGFLAMGAAVISSYTAISSGTSNEVVVALNRDLQGQAGSEIMTKTEGSSPNQVFIVQWKGYKKYGSTGTGDNYNFQIRLYETSNNMQFVYGTMTNNATAATPQLGLRGDSNLDFNNRTTTTDWTASIPGTLNTATMTLSSTVYPPSGLTYTFTLPSILNPTGVSATPITAHQIDVAFTPYSGNNVVLVFNLTGIFTTPSGLPPAPGQPFAGGTLLYTGLTSPYHHMSLNASTTYYYRLFTYGGGNYSTGTSVSATTLCEAISVFPWTEGFESVIIPAMANCWFKENGDWVTTNNDNTTFDADAHTGTQFLRDSYSATNEYVWSPGYVLNASTSYDFSFYWAGDNYAGWTGDVFYNTLQLSTGATQLGTSFVVDATVTTKNYAQAIYTFVPSVSGTYYFAIRVNCPTSTPWYLSFDDFRFEPTPACPMPTGLTATGITDVSALIGWLNAATVDIDYGTPGHPAGTGTIINTVSTNPYSLGGLTASTSYDVYVRQNCGGGSFSSWAGPLSFTTACNVVTAPWTEDFEDGAVPPACWSLTGSGGLWGASSAASGYGTGVYSAMADFYSISTGTEEMVSFGYNASGMTGQALRFDWAYAAYSASYIDELDLYYSTDSGVNWTLLLAMPGGFGILNPYGLLVTSEYVPASNEWSTITLLLPSNANKVKFTAISAYGNQLYVDNIKIVQPLANDVGTVSVDVPGSISTGTIAPKATVKNFGTATNTFTVQMTITGGYSSTKTVTSLASGTTQQVTFDNWNATPGSYTVQVCTQLGSDGDPTNDCRTKDVGVFSGSWAYKSAIPVTTYFGTGSTYIQGNNGYLLSFGGVTSTLLHTECFKYDVTADTWTTLAPLPAGRDRLASAVVGNFGYAIAGYDVTSTLQVSTVYKYDIAGNTWTTVAPLPAAIGWGKAVGYNNNYIYHAGGYDGVNYRSDVYLYNVTTDTWTAATSMPVAAFGGAFSIVGNKLIYVGGATPTGLSQAVYIGTIDAGNPALIVWTTAASYPGIQKSVRTRFEGDLSKLINPGGSKKDPSIEAAVYPPGGMYRFDAAPWGTDGIIVTTGCNTDYPPVDPNPCYSYNITTDTWIQQADLPSPVVGSSFGSVNSGTTWKLIVASGDTTGSGTATIATQIYTDNLGGTNTFQLSVAVSLGWNMTSVPGTNPDGMLVGNWWVNHVGTVYKFVPGSGYSGITTTAPGEGYWMKNSITQTYNTGDEWPAGGIQLVTHNPINAAAKWNMFGGYEDIVDPAALTTTPPSQIIYPIYKFVPGSGYQTATQIVPGYGYWIKVNAACQIIVPNVLVKSNQVMAEIFKDDWGKIIITDAAGSSYTLYAVKGQVDLDQYELPPLPPAGLFDVRFGSGRVAEDINSSAQSIEMSGVTFPVKVKVENMDIRLQDATGKIVNTNVKSGEEVTISNGNINKLMVSGNLIPDKYALEQNYPNPFNPSTTIEFSLPENVKNVRVSIYNLLGEKVAEVVNGALVAGKYQYQWNAKDLASGMYIYELRTEKFVSIKKMMLLK